MPVYESIAPPPGKKPEPVTPTRPEFENPPLIEQVITVVFDELAGFGIGDIGRFWTAIEDAFPICEAAPPVETVVELLPNPAVPHQTEVFIAQPVPVQRALFKQREGGELLQIQPDRFTFNWTKFGDAPYPRSEATMARFSDLFGAFERYVRARAMAPVTIRQCELANVNIIEVGDLPGSYADAPRIFETVGAEPELKCLHAESYMHNSTCLISDETGHFVGRLHTSLKPVLRVTDNVPAYRYELTARSGRLSEGMADAEAFFSRARDAINATFMASTTSWAHEHWGERHG